VVLAQIQAINQLNMLGYTTTVSTGVQQQQGTADLSTDGGAGGNGVGTVDQQASRGSKESRRSWTSKHKPHTCQHPGCRKSYFFVHDLRRHLRQKHDGMDYNDSLGKYEPASVGEGVNVGDIVEGVHHGSPMGGVHHRDGGDVGGETDDGSPDESDDNEEDDVMAMALTGAGGGGKEVAA